MKSTASVYDETWTYTFFKCVFVSSLRPTAIRCVASVILNFFLRQWHAAFLPGRIPVNRVDHPLDQKIPFVPSWITIYIDFAGFWIRMLSFLMRHFGRRAYGLVREFMEMMGKLYYYVAQVYQKNLSTTDRPFYIAHPRFILIQLLDPHLMCIPSLHVMVVTWAYTKFAAMLRSLGEEEKYAAQIEEIKQGALAITQAVLFVKQHSVNCIPATLYAMTRFDAALLPPEEAESFVNQLFNEPPKPASGARASARTNSTLANSQRRPSAAPRTKLPAQDIAEIKAYIITLYRQFLAEETSDWKEPLLNFVRQMPKK